MSRKTRNLIWSVPLVAVLAVAGALAMFVALVPDGVQADHIDPPGSVTDLVVEVLARSEIKVSWKNPEGTVDSYRIDTSTDTYVWMSKVESTTNVMVDANDGTVTYTDIEELDATAPRYYRVFAINAAGIGLAPLQDYAKADGISPTPPGTTQDLVATAASHNQINLSWSQPSDTGHTEITVYCISVSRPDTAFELTLPMECTPEQDDTDVTELATINRGLLLDEPTAATIVVEADDDNARQRYEHKVLQGDTRYRYRVYGVNSEGAATVGSNIASATTRGAPSGTTATAPDAVRNLRAVLTTNANAVDLYWNLPADQDPNATGFMAPEYTVQFATSANLPAANATGVNGWSEHVGTTGSPITLHEWSHSVTEPDEPATLHYRVRVGTSGTWATFSMSRDAFTENLVLVPPARADTMKIANAVGSLNDITLRWDSVPQSEGANRPNGYELDFVEGDVDEAAAEVGKQYWSSILPEARSGYGRSPITHRGLKPDTAYIYRIFPYKGGVYGPPVDVDATTEPAVAPDTRLNLSVSAYGPTKLKLDWNEPRNDGGSNVTGYYIEVSNDVDNDRIFEGTDVGWIDVNGVTDTTAAANGPADGDQAEWETDDADTMEYTYVGLEPSDVRWFRVIALNSATALDPNNNDVPDTEAMEALGSAVPVDGQTARASLPAAPNGLVTEQARNSNYTGTSNRGVLLLWNAPDDPQGDALTGYFIGRKVGMDGTWDDEWQEIDEPAPRTYKTDNELLGEGEMRYYRVAAVNDEGTGPWSNISMYPADTSHMEPPALGNAGVPMAGPTDNNDPGSIKLSWTAGENANVHWVVVVLVDANGDFDVNNSVWTQASAQDSHTVAMETEGLIPGNYRAMVIAGMHDSDAGTTQWSTWQNTQFTYPQ